MSNPTSLPFARAADDDTNNHADDTDDTDILQCKRITSLPISVSTPAPIRVVGNPRMSVVALFYFYSFNLDPCTQGEPAKDG